LSCADHYSPPAISPFPELARDPSAIVITIIAADIKTWRQSVVDSLG
jgi:hypothetical protein